MTYSMDGALRRSGILALSLLVACTAGDGGSAPENAEIPVLSLGEPTLEIGTVDGPEPYAFAAIETVMRLPDGRVAVSDAGATLVEIFEDSGEHVVSWGRRGDGPAEFTSLSRLYPLGSDSLMAAERFSGRLSVFDLDGEFSRLIPGSDLSGDSIFTLDSWLYQRFWVDGALTADARRRTRAVLDRLPLPTEAPGYRAATRGDDGSLWIKEPDRSEGAHLWTRLDESGVPTGMMSIPARFAPTHFRADEVLGVWRGEADVHFVRAYSLYDQGGETGLVPAWLTADRTAPSVEVAPDMEEVMALVRSSIKQMASAQEIHYSTHMSYSSEVDSLTAFEMPEELSIDFIKGDARGWAGVFAHPEVDRICGLAYGFGIPAGWTPGMVVCAPEAAQTDGEG